MSRKRPPGLLRSTRPNDITRVEIEKDNTLSSDYLYEVASRYCSMCGKRGPRHHRLAGPTGGIWLCERYGTCADEFDMVDAVLHRLSKGQVRMSRFTGRYNATTGDKL